MAKEEKKGFTIIANEVIEMNLPPVEKTILIVLLRYNNSKIGYSFPSYTTLTEKCCISKKTVIKALNNLEKKGIIKKECLKGKGNKYFITDFENYTSVKTTPVEKLHQCKNYTSVETTPHRCKNYTSLVENLHPINTNTITNTITNNNMSDSKESDTQPGAFKEDNNSDNKKSNSNNTKAETNNYTKEIKEIINYLNLKANRNYRLVEANKDIIKARFNESKKSGKEYTVEDFKQVIDYKVAEWIDAEWTDKQGNLVKGKKYLQPSTLFSRKNFDNYLNSAKDWFEENSQNNPKEDIKPYSIEEMLKPI